MKRSLLQLNMQTSSEEDRLRNNFDIEKALEHTEIKETPEPRLNNFLMENCDKLPE